MHKGTMTKKRNCLLLAACIGLMPLPGIAQIRTDGSVGPAARTLTGPDYLIPESLGRLSGNNLFHSFRSFNIDYGESATFTTSTAGIANVLGRVSGGEPSYINGGISLLAASGRPALFLINPAGIVFGYGAWIDVPGAFHVGTADYIGFADGSRFHADTAKTSSFSSAPPAAFGFLGTQRNTLLLTPWTDLEVYPGQKISVVAGDIGIENAGVHADGGDIRVAAVGLRETEVPLSGPLPAAFGNLYILDGGWFDAQSIYSNRGGSISVRAGDIYVDGLGNSSGTGFYGSALYGRGNAATMDIRAESSIGLYDGSFISATTRTRGSGGTVTLVSPLIEIIDSLINVSSNSSAKAGTINLSGEQIVLYNGGALQANANSTGAAGNIRVDAGELILVSGSNWWQTPSAISVQTAGYVPAGSIELNAPNVIISDDGQVSGYASAGEPGATAGNIRISAKRLVLENGGKISLEGYDGAGHGSVTVEASDSLRITGKGEAPDPSPGADMVSTGIIGYATDIRIVSPEITISESGAIRSESWWQDSPGNIVIDTQRLSVLSGGHISGNALGHSYTPGIGAPITINAGEYVLVEGSRNGRDSSIASGTRSSGAAGSIGIVTPWLRVADNGVINTSTGRFGTSAAGSISIDVDRLELLNGGRLASIEFGHLASGGQIGVTARESILIDGGHILAWSGNEAAAGQIRLSAPDIRLHAATITSQNDETALPGDILISAGKLDIGGGSVIQANSTSSEGAGGIRLNVADDLRIDDSSILTTADYAGGGNIALQAGRLLLLRDSLVTTSVFGSTAGSGGNIDIGALGLILENGFIQANTLAQGGSGGQIGIDARMLIPSGNTLLLGGQTPYAFQSGLANFNVIQAAAPTGINGTINLTTPVLDLSGTVLGLNTQMIDTGGLGRNPCHSGGGSSLSQGGRGGLPPSARDLLGPASHELAGGQAEQKQSAGEFVRLAWQCQQE